MFAENHIPDYCRKCPLFADDLDELEILKFKIDQAFALLRDMSEDDPERISIRYMWAIHTHKAAEIRARMAQKVFFTIGCAGVTMVIDFAATDTISYKCDSMSARIDKS